MTKSRATFYTDMAILWNEIDNVRYGKQSVDGWKCLKCVLCLLASLHILLGNMLWILSSYKPYHHKPDKALHVCINMFTGTRPNGFHDMTQKFIGKCC